MLDTVKNKLREIYDSLYSKQNTILGLFIDQFGEPFVDSDIHTFDELVQWLNSRTLESFINSYESENDYGHYSIDRQDYDTNGRGKPFLEYIPDLGILDYIISDIKRFLYNERSSSVNNIIVHFPNVKVTNEYDKSIDIQDLYAIVKITREGKLHEGFQFIRATYPYSHFRAGYAHSHMHMIDSSNICNWVPPCTGSGPINSTMNTIRHNYDEQFWGLFTFELAKYVTVESVAGGPHIRLEEVYKGNVDESMSNLNCESESTIPVTVRHIINAFIKHYAQKCKFKFKFVNGQYQIGESPVSTIIHLSNEFIEFLNDYRLRIANVPTLRSLKNQRILQSYIVSNNRIYQVSSTDYRNLSAANRVNGRRLLNFKGNEVRLKIIIDDNVVENDSLLLNKTCCGYIITNVLNIINYQYGKQKQEQNCQASQASCNQCNTQAARTGEKLCFI